MLEEVIKEKSYKRVIIMWVLALCILVFQYVLEVSFGISLAILRIHSNSIRVILILLLIFLPFKFNWKNHRILKRVYAIISVLITIFVLFIATLVFSGDRYFYFESPKGSRTLVVQETSVLFSGSSCFYEKKYGFFLKRLDSYIITDDGYRPFSNDTYELKWENEDRAILKYSFGSGGVHESEIIDLNKSRGRGTESVSSLNGWYTSNHTGK